MRIIPTGRVTPRYNGSTLSKRQRRMQNLSARERAVAATDPEVGSRIVQAREESASARPAPPSQPAHTTSSSSGDK